MKPIDRWTQQKKTLINRVQEHIADLNALTDQVHIFLPEDWRAYCQVVRFDPAAHLVVLSTTEQELVTALRYRQQQLLTQLHRKFPCFKEITSIKSIYSPSATPRAAKIRVPRIASVAVQACSLAAEHCRPDLKAALEKLSKTLSVQKERS